MSSEKNAMNFWYEFDDYFLFHSPADIGDAVKKLNPYVTLRNRFYYYQEKGTIEEGFKKEFEAIKDSIK